MDTTRTPRWLMAAFTALMLGACGAAVDAADADSSAASPVLGTHGTCLFTVVAEEAVHPGTNRFKLRLQRAENGSALTGANVQVDMMMPAMGHGSSATPTVRDDGDGHYTVDGVVFTMTGAWEVTYRVTVDDVTDSATYAYDVQ